MRRLLPLMISKAETQISQSAVGSRTLTQRRVDDDLPIDKERDENVAGVVRVLLEK